VLRWLLILIAAPVFFLVSIAQQLQMQPVPAMPSGPVSVGTVPQSAAGIAVPGAGHERVDVPPGMVSPADLAKLAMAAGWTGEDLVRAVAISLAEDGAGNPTALSPANNDGSRDFCLWQINSTNWPAFGGQAALADPQTCANAAHTLWLHGGWTLWCTYDNGCGYSHVGTYRANLDTARAAIGLASQQPGEESMSATLVGGHAFPLPGWTGSIQLHWGVAAGGSDLFAPRGQPVVAVESGSVTEAGYESVGGNEVLIKGSDGLLYYYAHLNSAPMVSTGQHVQAGQQLGVVGNTGDAAGLPTHLHIGIGHSILLGADATGGTGSGFDAVAFLRQLYGGG
jgi:murein DD-endopeptidase MepM/ murein hydrolase activator NlpD